MKLPHASLGAAPMQPAYDTFRASVRAAQATTPTAIASSHVDRPRHVIALSGFLGELAVGEAHQSWLTGSFYISRRLPDGTAL